MKQTASEYYQNALEKFRRGDLTGAIANLDRVIDLNPDSLAYYLERGDWKYRLDDLPSAIQDFDRVISSSQDKDDLREAHSKRAICLNELKGDSLELLPDLDWLIEHGFGTGNIYSWRGTVKLNWGQPEAAIADFTQAHRLEAIPMYLLKRAHAYYAAHQYDSAIQDLTRIIDSKHGWPSTLISVVHYWRAKAYYKTGLDKEALDDLNQQLRLEGRGPVPTIEDYMALYGLDD